MASVTHTTFLGQPALAMEAAGYTALVLPRQGGNVVRLQWGDQADCLRTPPTLQALLDDPYCYGIPILFPPNRISGAAFVFEGRHYTFPVNHAKGAHVHGMLKLAEWRVERTEADADARVVLTLSQAQCKALCQGFANDFSAQYTLTLGQDGLSMELMLTNHSPYNMPVALAYHTTFNLPFNGSDPAQAAITANLAAQYELDPDFYPTGNLLPLGEGQQPLVQDGFHPYPNRMDMLYLADDTVPNEAVLTDQQTGTSIHYCSDPQFRQWIVYSREREGTFVCIEPQTCPTDPWNNHALTPAQKNVIVVAPYNTFCATTRIFVKPGGA